jgi:hypothetical protein
MTNRAGEVEQVGEHPASLLKARVTPAQRLVIERRPWSGEPGKQ